MNFRSRKVKVMAFIAAAVVLIVAFRIYTNIQNERERAASMSRSRAVAVETAKPQRVAIRPSFVFSGSLDPEWQADVAAKVDGRLEKVHVREGDRVSRGQVLAVLEQTDTDADLLNARGAYTDAEINLRKAEADLARYEKLYASGAVSQQAVDDYRFARDNAAARLDSARGNLQSMEAKSSGTVLTAPADGIIAKRYYQEGYYAKAGTPIFSVADISRLKTIVHIPEGQIDSVKVGNTADITLSAYPGRKIQGTVTRISPVADLPSHTFETEIQVDNTEGMLAGLYATVTLSAVPRDNVLTIPVYAIVMRDDQKTVFVVNDEGVVQRRVLSVGYSDDKVAEIISGLDGTETIVTEGHNKLREGSRIDMKKAGK